MFQKIPFRNCLKSSKPAAQSGFFEEFSGKTKASAAIYKDINEERPQVLTPKLPKKTVWIRNFWQIIFPKNCLICNKIIRDGYFCPEDWNKLRFLEPPACFICHQPFLLASPQGKKILCAKCLQKKPSYYRALAVLKYDHHSRNLITGFKYYGQTYLAKYFASLLNKKLPEIWPEIDFIAPVPLHRWRLWRRQYNQSALLARFLSKSSGRKIIPDLLLRHKNTMPQARLRQKSRYKNIAGAFSLKAKYREVIKEKNILLIDDVITSGATIEACAKVLLKAKANRIYVATLAKTTLD